MEDELKQFMRDLQDAIQESLSDSSSFLAILDRIEDAGYDLSLVVEAILEVKAGAEAADQPRQTNVHDPTQIKLTPQDRDFLQLLRIADDTGDLPK